MYQILTLDWTRLTSVKKQRGWISLDTELCMVESKQMLLSLRKPLCAHSCVPPCHKEGEMTRPTHMEVKAGNVSIIVAARMCGS